MQGFNVDDIQNQEDIADICSDLNKLVRKKHNASDGDKIAQAEAEIKKQMTTLDSAMKGEIAVRESVVVAEDAETKQVEISQPNIESEGMHALLRTDKRNTKYYTVISKEKAREEIADLVEYYPEHSFYAVTDIMDEEGEECFTMVMDDRQENPLAYYPALDSAKTELERKKVMEEFLSEMKEYYIYSKPLDFFAR